MPWSRRTMADTKAGCTGSGDGPGVGPGLGSGDGVGWGPGVGSGLGDGWGVGSGLGPGSGLGEGVGLGVGEAEQVAPTRISAAPPKALPAWELSWTMRT